jgi:hypothetical protein
MSLFLEGGQAEEKMREKLRFCCQENFKGVGGPYFRPKACTDDVSYTPFPRENVPLSQKGKIF